jgi:hypothetical protein
MALSDAIAVFSGLAAVSAITTGLQGVITLPFATNSEVLRTAKIHAQDAGSPGRVERIKEDAQRARKHGRVAVGLGFLVNVPVTASWLYFVAISDELCAAYFWAPPLSVAAAIIGLAIWAAIASSTLHSVER